MSGLGYVREIQSIDAEIRRLSLTLKALRLQKRNAQTNLYNYMISHNLEKMGDGKDAITLKKCAPPKPRAKVKPKKLRKDDAIELFREAGINDPIKFYEDFELTQKNTPLINNEDDQFADEPRYNTTKKGKKNDYDDDLGF